MDCIKNNKQGVEILTDYCAGTANPVVAAEIDAHLKHCADCRATLDAQRAVWEMLDAWSPVEVSPDFDTRLYARIAGDQSQPVWRRWWSRILQPATPYSWWKPAASLAAAGAVLLLALTVQTPNQTALLQQGRVQQESVPQKLAQQKSTGAQSAASSDEIDLQQVQQALDDLDIVAPATQATSSPL